MTLPIQAVIFEENNMKSYRGKEIGKGFEAL
jgi:hypothetical protein